MAPIMLIDGNSLAYRAFFALPTDLATASGQVTNAVYGFSSMLINLLKDHQPSGLAVAFDRPEPTFRHDLVPDYKAGRAEAPDILRQQLGLVRQVVETLKIPVVEAVGFEADDVIATLATQARDRGLDVIVVTGDRDAYQLVEDPHIRVLYNRRGVSDYALYDEAGILERTGVTPTMYPQYAAMRGDPSDNLPGVPGVGEKTAARLLNTYGDLDGVFSHLGELTPKLSANMAAHEERVRLNATATPLIRDVPLDLDVAGLTVGDWDPTEVRDLFNFLEFTSLHPRLLDALNRSEAGAGSGADAPPDQGEPVDVVIERATDAAKALAALGDGVSIAAAWEAEPVRSALLGIAVAAPQAAAPQAPADPAAGGGPGVAASTVVWIGSDLLAHPDVQDRLATVAFHSHQAKALMRGLNLDLRGLSIDTAIASYLIDPAQSGYVLVDLARRYAGIDVSAPDAPPPGQLDLSGTASDPADDAARSAVGIARLVPMLEEAMAARGLTRLYDEIERPLVRVLARMETTGVRVDVARLREVFEALVVETSRLEAEIQELAGETFLVNSTQQLRRILFDKLELAPQKKTKTGFSTDAASLEKLRGQHPIIEALLRYREVEKLRSTYGENLLGEVAADGRIHATFNQTVARTGRLSSDRPNLHNIPVRAEEGRRIRSAFIPDDGLRFLVADYNQIELRVIAHLAQDPGLIEAFASGQDIHRATAARLFDVEPAEVTLGQRSKAKMVSYGLAYGMESYGLAQRLGIGVDEASVILKAYFEAFPSVRAYMDATVAEARDRGYTETLFGRRRQIPELSSSNFRLRQAGERQAMNAGIQGLAADIFKVALIRLDRALDAGGWSSRLVLQVHDEVILEVPPHEEEPVAALTVEAMSGAAELSVPLEVNVSWGTSWATAKG